MKQSLKLFLFMLATAGAISAYFCGNIGTDLYRNGFVIYDETALIRFITIGLLSAFVATALYFRLSGRKSVPTSNDLQIEADMTRRANLPTHLRLKKT